MITRKGAYPVDMRWGRIQDAKINGAAYDGGKYIESYKGMIAMKGERMPDKTYSFITKNDNKEAITFKAGNAYHMIKPVAADITAGAQLYICMGEDIQYSMVNGNYYQITSNTLNPVYPVIDEQPNVQIWIPLTVDDELIISVNNITGTVGSNMYAVIGSEFDPATAAAAPASGVYFAFDQKVIVGEGAEGGCEFFRGRFHNKKATV